MKTVTLEVRVSNYPAVKLYRKNDFKVVSVIKQYYGNEDAYLMVAYLE